MKRATYLMVAAAVLFGACSDDVTQPVRIPVSASLHATELKLTPNSVRYRPAKYKNTRGRSGDATLIARALLGKDGNTDLDITTGELDAAAPPPQIITKLQLKLITANGEVFAVENHNNLSKGNTAFVFPDRPLHSRIQVLGHVLTPNTSGKGMRTGVIALEEQVNLRPDLAVRELTAPQQMPAGVPFAVRALIKELNLDVAATADCVLYVDGVEKDRATGIWIAEGDGVNCSFMYSTTDIGTHELRVTAENVVPGDYDGANNSATISIQIGAPTMQLVGRAYAKQTIERYNRTDRGHFGYWGDAQHWFSGAWEDLIAVDDYRLFAGFITSVPRALTFPVQRFRVAQFGDGTIDVTNFGEPGTGCRFTNNGTTEIFICVAGDQTFVNGDRLSGHVNYYSKKYTHFHNCTRVNSVDTCVTGTTGPTEEFGYRQMGNNVFQPAGATTYWFDILVEDEDVNLVANPVMTYGEPFSYSMETPYACQPHQGGQKCYGSSYWWFERPTAVTF